MKRPSTPGRSCDGVDVGHRFGRFDLHDEEGLGVGSRGVVVVEEVEAIVHAGAVDAAIADGCGNLVASTRALAFSGR